MMQLREFFLYWSGNRGVGWKESNTQAFLIYCGGYIIPRHHKLKTSSEDRPITRTGGAHKTKLDKRSSITRKRVPLCEFNSGNFHPRPTISLIDYYTIMANLFVSRRIFEPDPSDPIMMMHCLPLSVVGWEQFK